MPIFDGPNKTITLDPPTAGILLVSVQPDLYSAWKNWMRMGDNGKFLPAFRAAGGDDLTPGVQAGAYFFLRNDLGWRIISSDEDQTINYSGNLIGNDSSLPLILATPGRSVLHLGLQPVTQRVDEIITSQETASYNGTIWIDPLGPVSGTAYPAGTASTPVNNWTDADAIADLIGVENFRLRHLLVMPVDEVLNGYTISGDNPVNSQLHFQGGQCTGLSLTNLSFGGMMGEGFFTASQCITGALMNVDCGLFECTLNGPITLDANPSGTADISFMNCVSGFPGSSGLVIDCNGTTADIQFRNWSGGVTITNFTNPTSNMSLDSSQGTINLDPSCTAGLILVRGIGILNDNSGPGCTVVRDGLVEPRRIEMTLDHARAANQQTKEQ